MQAYRRERTDEHFVLLFDHRRFTFRCRAGCSDGAVPFVGKCIADTDSVFSDHTGPLSKPHPYWFVFNDSSMFGDGKEDREWFDIVSIEAMSDGDSATHKKVCGAAGFLE